jgi:hypothetical protein
VMAPKITAVMMSEASAISSNCLIMWVFGGLDASHHYVWGSATVGGMLGPGTFLMSEAITTQ